MVRLRGEIRRLETIETRIETDNRATLAKHQQALATAKVRETELAAQLMAANDLQRRTEEQLKASSGVLHGVTDELERCQRINRQLRGTLNETTKALEAAQTTVLHQEKDIRSLRAGQVLSLPAGDVRLRPWSYGGPTPPERGQTPGNVGVT